VGWAQNGKIHSYFEVSEGDGNIESYAIRSDTSNKQLCVAYVTDKGKAFLWEPDKIIVDSMNETSLVELEGNGEDGGMGGVVVDLTLLVIINEEVEEEGKGKKNSLSKIRKEKRQRQNQMKGVKFSSDGSLCCWSKEHILVFEFEAGEKNSNSNSNSNIESYKYVKTVVAGEEGFGICDAAVNANGELRVILEDGWLYQVQ